MKRLVIGIITTSIVAQMCSTRPVSAAAATLESTVDTAQQALEQQQYKRAETMLRKAVDLAVAANTQDVYVARAAVLLSQALRGSEKMTLAGEALEQAHSTYKTLGFVEPSYVEEMKNLADSFQRIDLSVLGSAADTLKTNSATVSMAKSGSGGHVEIHMPAPYENSINNPKVNGVQLEKVVMFEIEQPDSVNIHVSKIKGLKIHSVEKNTWVNLLDLAVGAADSDGKFDATITAGKAGITKTVASKLPAQAYEPVLAIAKRIMQFGTMGELDLPVVAVKPKEETKTAPPATTSAPPAATSAPPVTTSAPPVTTSAPPVTTNPVEKVSKTAASSEENSVSIDIRPKQKTNNGVGEITQSESASGIPVHGSETKTNEINTAEVKPPEAKQDENRSHKSKSSDGQDRDHQNKSSEGKSSMSKHSHRDHDDHDDDDDDDDDGDNDKHTDKDRHKDKDPDNKID